MSDLLFTDTGAEDVTFTLVTPRPLRPRTLTVGELRKHLRKFRDDQPIFFCDDEGEPEPIRYAELHEFRK